MTRNASQTAMNPISSSGMAQPASTPSIQIRNGFRHRAGETLERAAIAENARSMALIPGKTAWAQNSTRAAGKAKPIPPSHGVRRWQPVLNGEAACLELLKKLNVPNLNIGGSIEVMFDTRALRNMFACRDYLTIAAAVVS